MKRNKSKYHKTFISPEWTLEWVYLNQNTLKIFMLVLSKVHIKQNIKVKSDVDYEEN